MILLNNGITILEPLQINVSFITNWTSVWPHTEGVSWAGGFQ